MILYILTHDINAPVREKNRTRGTLTHTAATPPSLRTSCPANAKWARERKTWATDWKLLERSQQNPPHSWQMDAWTDKRFWNRGVKNDFKNKTKKIKPNLPSESRLHLVRLVRVFLPIGWKRWSVFPFLPQDRLQNTLDNLPFQRVVVCVVHCLLTCPRDLSYTTRN